MMLMSYGNDVTCVFSAPIWSHVFPFNMEKLDIIIDYELGTSFKDPKLKRDSNCHFQVVYKLKSTHKVQLETNIKNISNQ